MDLFQHRLEDTIYYNYKIQVTTVKVFASRLPFLKILAIKKKFFFSSGTTSSIDTQ